MANYAIGEMLPHTNKWTSSYFFLCLTSKAESTKVINKQLSKYVKNYKASMQNCSFEGKLRPSVMSTRLAAHTFKLNSIEHINF